MMTEADQKICAIEGPRGQREERDDTRETEQRGKETESGSYRVNVAVCLAEAEERVLHQLQLGSKGSMDKTTQQGSKVRRPLSARANWSLRPELTPTFLWRNTYTCMKRLSDRGLPSKAPIKEASVVLCTVMEISQAFVVTISSLARTSPPAPPTVTARLDA